ncbi:hypothetical protein QYE76_032715 [Lolium multiflorum]|uniref:Integrase catalytic domain-containing protein n=1 Tax=Lolium multiflorum TaxID=4521 RepID=A0AAD8QW92_LOLMU|nr:hypothetical protein QYE76_032715 [Lolium multiflorum]
MTGGKNLVKELRPNIHEITVSFGDNSTSEVLGFGKVVVAHNITLVDVMLVKTLGYNLLSISALGRMGFTVFIDNDIVVLLWSKTLKVAFVGYREHNLYVVDFSGATTSSAMCLFGKADVGWLWHRSLAHVNMRNLQSLHKGNHIVGLMENVYFAKDRVSRACIKGKMHHSPHPSKTIISSKRILELLHVDLFGPTTHASLGVKKYCLVIVDDYSRYTWVYFLKKKDETQQIFIDFATEVQRQHNLLIMAIRSDNGSEFKNYTLNDFLSDEGKRHQYSAAYTPQQNGVAERKNWTLMDMARSMIAEYKSRYNFWAEAISTACHSSNRLYLCKGLNKTPYEILTGNKPNISYFKVFGCKCFYKIKGVCLSKFAPKALESIFVGYGAESHTYRVFDISSKIIIKSCSVKFEENDGSQVGQVDVCAGDEIPQDAILMTDRFEMSMMGEMRFFLGFEIKQLREGTFINQAKYLQDMLKRLKMTEMKGVATPMVTKCHLALDPNGGSKKRGKGHVVEQEEEDFEVTRPTKLTSRQQSAQRNVKSPAAHGKKTHVSVKNMPYLEYKELRWLWRYFYVHHIGAATKLLDDMMVNYSEWHTGRAPQGKKVNSVEETSSLSDKIDVIMSMLVNGRSNVDPNNVPLASLVAQEENVDVNFIKNNNFNNNAYRNNSGNNYRPYPSANGNGYGNSYGNSYNNNRSVPSGLEAMLKEFISTQTAFNKSVEEKLDKIDTIASRVDRLASDVNLLKLKVMPNNDLDNKITTTANAIQVRINENIRLMAELRARWDREENEKLAKENNVAKVWTITTTSNANSSHVAAPPTINGKIIGVGNVSTPNAKRTKLPEIAKTAETACDKTAEIFSNLGNNDPIAIAHNDLDFDDCHISEVIKFLQKLAKSPNASAINLAFTKHITNALIKAREEKLKLETSIPRKLEDGWEPIIKMKFNDFESQQGLDIGLIQQFYATVHFEQDEAKTFRWMTHETLLEANLASFGAALGYPRSPVVDENGWRSHDSSFALTKDMLEPLYIKGWGIPGKSADLLPTWDIMLRVYRETIGPKGCNLDEMHTYEVDLMANSHAKQGTGERLDVMDYIYNEMWSCVMEKKLPIFAPTS